MEFNFYEVTGGCIPHECKEHVQLDDWESAEDMGRELSHDWGNRVRIELYNTDEQETVGTVSRERLAEIRVDNRINAIIDQNEQREARAMEAAKL